MVQKVRGKFCFIPISLGNHYYTNERLNLLVRDVVPASKESVVVVCDRLRVLSYQLRVMHEREARQKADREFAEFKNRLSNCGADAAANLTVLSWHALSEQPDYADFPEFVSEVSALVNANNNICDYLDLLIRERLKRFDYPANDVNYRLQKQYIVEETALSLYFTERKKFQVEIYARKTDGLVDFLQENFADDLLGLLNKKDLDREFLPIEDFEHNTGVAQETVSSFKRFFAKCFWFIRRYETTIEIGFGLVMLALIALQTFQVKTSLDQIKHSMTLDQYQNVHEHKQRINQILLQREQGAQLAQDFLKIEIKHVLAYTIINDYENLVDLRCNTESFDDQETLWKNVQSMIIKTFSDGSPIRDFWDERKGDFSARFQTIGQLLIEQKVPLNDSVVDEVCQTEL